MKLFYPSQHFINLSFWTIKPLNAKITTICKKKQVYASIFMILTKKEGIFNFYVTFFVGCMYYIYLFISRLLAFFFKITWKKLNNSFLEFFFEKTKTINMNYFITNCLAHLINAKMNTAPIPTISLKWIFILWIIKQKNATMKLIF